MRRLLFGLLIVAFVLFPSLARAQGVDEALEQCARQVAKQVTAAGLKRVGVPEMTNGTTDQLGGSTGTAGQYFAAKLADELAKAGQGAFVVVERNRLNRVLQEGKFEASGLTDPKASQELLGKIPGLDCLVDGTLTRFDVTHMLELTCRVIRYPEAVNLGSVTVKFELDPDLLGLFGVSYHHPAEKPSKPEIVQAALHPDTGAAPACPYAVEVLAGGVPAPLYTHQGNLYLPATSGEVFAVRLTNHTDRAVAVALFLDGLNSIFARRELPSQATRWVVAAHTSAVVNGWQEDMERRRQFVFVTSDESLAARRHFTEQLGLITAAFFPEIPGAADNDTGTRDLGIGQGEVETSHVALDKRHFSALPTTSLTLRYDDRKIVEKYTAAK